MNIVRYASDTLETFLKQRIIATMVEMRELLGTSVNKTILRKLKTLSYCTSYSHGGTYYTLEASTKFNEKGLWCYSSVWFSRYGSLMTSLHQVINISEAGYLASELKAYFHVSAKESLLRLLKRQMISRTKVSGFYLYCSADLAKQRHQVTARQLLNCTEEEDGSHKLNAALILFMSLLDEKQRRVYAGLESIKAGHGGDRKIANLLGLSAQTVAKGRHELLKQDVEGERIRKPGAGRAPVKKNA